LHINGDGALHRPRLCAKLKISINGQQLYNALQHCVF
jgi:hypothetical protein